mgnify:CR=1 FL=1
MKYQKPIRETTGSNHKEREYKPYKKHQLTRNKQNKITIQGYVILEKDKNEYFCILLLSKWCVTEIKE